MFKLLGIKIDNISLRELNQKIEAFLASDNPHFLTTPNPEIILRAARSADEEYFYILNQADLSLPDGTGLKFAALASGQNLKRIMGSDLTLALLAKAEKEGRKILVINRKDGLSKEEDINQALKQKYPRLNFKVLDLPRIATEFPEETLKTINDYGAEIIFSTFGAPYQEKSLYHSLDKIKGAKILIGVGGSFDFITGKIKRAPRLMTSWGLEWLWRLIKQPRKRIKRIINAVIIFPWEVFKWRFIHPLAYRPNVACFLYKKEAGSYKILLVERQEEPGHWQLPQGGTDGEKLEIAGARELREEVGSSNFRVAVCYSNLYRYRSNKIGDKYGYQGQKQGLCIAEFLGKDEEIKINFWDHRNFQWVEESLLLKKVHPIRREATETFLKKFQEAKAENKL